MQDILENTADHFHFQIVHNISSISTSKWCRQIFELEHETGIVLGMAGEDEKHILRLYMETFVHIFHLVKFHVGSADVYQVC